MYRDPDSAEQRLIKDLRQTVGLHETTEKTRIQTETTTQDNRYKLYGHIDKSGAIFLRTLDISGYQTDFFHLGKPMSWVLVFLPLYILGNFHDFFFSKNSFQE